MVGVGVEATGDELDGVEEPLGVLGEVCMPWWPSSNSAAVVGKKVLRFGDGTRLNRDEGVDWVEGVEEDDDAGIVAADARKELEEPKMILDDV